ncbi:MAG TPA: Na+/H+ antiporter NhaA, partial [Flavobacteriales bacterium]
GLGGVFSSTLTLGIFLGLVLGKPVGLMVMSWLFVRLGWGRLGEGVRWAHMLGISVMSGVGFTMAVFINELAFEDAVVREEAKLGILFASLVAGLIGFLLLRNTRSRTA